MTIVEITVFLPALFALAIPCGMPSRRTAIAGALFTLLSAVIAVSRFSLSIEGRFQTESSHTIFDVDGFPKVSLAFGIDGLSVVLILLTALVLLSAVWLAPKEEEITQRSPKFFYSACLLIGSAALGIFCTTDLFFLCTFYGVTLLVTLLIINTYGHGDDRKKQAVKVGSFLGSGCLLVFIGLIIIVRSLNAKTLDISDLIGRASDMETGISIGDQGMIYLILIIGTGILSALYPLHFWMRDIFTTAPRPITMLHAGVLRFFGIYVLIRIAAPVLPHGANDMSAIFLMFLLGNIIHIGISAMLQKDLDRMLTSFCVMSGGFAFLGLASGSRTGLIGTVLFMFANGVSFALLFGLSGRLKDKFGTLELKNLGELIGRQPRLSGLFGLAAFASIGLPGLALFPAELMIFFGAIDPTTANDSTGLLQVITYIAVIGLSIPAVFMIRTWRDLFYFQSKTEPVREPFTNIEMLPFVILMVPLIAVGVVPALLIQFIRAATEGISLLGVW